MSAANSNWTDERVTKLKVRTRQLVVDFLGIEGSRKKHARAPLAVRVFRQAEIDPETGCWEWTGAKNSYGYGVLGLGGARGAIRRAHRIAYEILRGAIPAGLNMDHLCRNPACINPDHLEPVTQGENVKRGRAGWHNKAKSHCVNGHEFTPANTIRVRGTEQRQCRACRDRRIREFRARQAERRAA